MDRARAEFMELQKMEFCSVTFMLAEAILGKLRAKVTHHSVAGDLGDHARRRNAQADAIAINDCGLRKRKRDHRQTVNQHVIGRFEQSFDGPVQKKEQNRKNRR